MEKTFTDRLKQIIGGCGTPPNFAEKTFVDGSQTSKSTKVFSLESFLLYGIIIPRPPARKSIIHDVTVLSSIVIITHTCMHTCTVVWMSLLIQNSLVALCSIVIALMFALEWDVCRHLILFACLTPLVIIFGSGANLASVANTISVEKDWVVVLADKNENTLAGKKREKYRKSGSFVVNGINLTKNACTLLMLT